MEPVADDAPIARIVVLERREAELVARLEQCIPPVDQHRAELERVRTELSAVRQARP